MGLSSGYARDQPALAEILQRDSTATRDAAHAMHRDDAAGATGSDLGCFGWMMGPRDRAEMLELRLKSGNIGAIPYGWIEFATFDPSEGIILEARGMTIRIRGRHLNAEVRPSIRLFEGITRHCVPWIREADRQECMEAPESATVIEAIEW